MMQLVMERKIIKLAVTGEGKEALSRIAERFGMDEYRVAGKIYEWFISQDDLFQRAVLGMLDGLEVDAARAFMEKLKARADQAAQRTEEPPRITHIRGGKVIHPKGEGFPDRR